MMTREANDLLFRQSPWIKGRFYFLERGDGYWLMETTFVGRQQKIFRCQFNGSKSEILERHVRQAYEFIKRRRRSGEITKHEKHIENQMPKDREVLRRVINS